MINNRNKILTYALCLTLFAVTISGCSSGSNTVGSGENTISDNNSLVAEETITYPLTLKVGYSTNDTDPRGVTLEQFKKVVEEKTNRNILIEIHPSGELGSDAELIAGIISKDVDMTVSSAGNYAAYATKVGVSALPFLFEDFEAAWKFMDSDITEDLNKELELYNMHVLAYFDNGFRCVTTSESVGPVDSVADMANLNIRTPENQIVMETMSQLGANPSSYPFAELKEALAKGQFDAEENPIPVIYNSALYEVQKYLSVTNHSYDAMPLTIRQDLWDMLPEEYRSIIETAAKDAAMKDRQLVKQQTQDYVKLLEEKGMVIIYPDIDEFRRNTKEVMNVFVTIYGKDLLERVKQYSE